MWEYCIKSLIKVSNPLLPPHLPTTAIILLIYPIGPQPLESSPSLPSSVCSLKLLSQPCRPLYVEGSLLFPEGDETWIFPGKLLPFSLLRWWVFGFTRSLRVSICSFIPIFQHSDININTSSVEWVVLQLPPPSILHCYFLPSSSCYNAVRILWALAQLSSSQTLTIILSMYHKSQSLLCQYLFTISCQLTYFSRLW